MFLAFLKVEAVNNSLSVQNTDLACINLENRLHFVGFMYNISLY